MKWPSVKQSISLLLSIFMLTYHTGPLLLVAAVAEDTSMRSMLDLPVFPHTEPLPILDPAESYTPQPAPAAPNLSAALPWQEQGLMDAAIHQGDFIASGRIFAAVGRLKMVSDRQELDRLVLPYREERQLTVVYEDDIAIDPLEVHWNSDDLDIVQIDQMGTLTAVGVGAARVTAALDGSSVACSVLVTPLAVELDYSDLTAVNKRYDGTTDAQITGQLKLKHSAFEVTFAKQGELIGEFVSKNASPAKKTAVRIRAAGYILDNPNYVMPDQIAYQLGAYIDPAPLTLKIPDLELPYGGVLPDYGVYRKIGVLGEEPKGEWDVSYRLNGRDAAVGDAGVYEVISSFDCTDSNYEQKHYVTTSKLTVTPKSLEIMGLSVKEKTYDGSLEASIEGTPLLSAQGDVYISGAPVGSYIDADAGRDKPVNVSGLQLKGKDAGNYVIAPVQLRGSISKRPLELVFAEPIYKVYDKSNRMMLDVSKLSLVGILPQDEGRVALRSAHATLESISPQPSVKVTEIDALWQTTDGDNYYILSKGLSVSIIPAPLRVAGLRAVGREYDGTTRVGVIGGELSGVLLGDQVILAGSAAGSLPSKNAGVHSVAVSGLTVEGAQKDCYTLEPLPTLLVEISPKVLMLTELVVADKVYDGGIDAIVQSALLAPALSGDDVTLLPQLMKAEFLNADAAADKEIRVDPYSGLGGRDKSNYQIGCDQNTARGRILKASPVLSLHPKSVLYTGSPVGLECSISNVGDPLKLSSQLRYSYVKQGEEVSSPHAPVDAGVYEVTAQLVETANYYGAVSPGALLRIAKADITAVVLEGKDFVYDGQEKSLAVQGEIPSGTSVEYQGNRQAAVGNYHVSATVTGNNHHTLTLQASLNILRDTPVLKLSIDKAYALQADIITIYAELVNSQTGKYESNLPQSLTLLVNETQSIELKGIEGRYQYQYPAPAMQGELKLQLASAQNASYLAAVSEQKTVLVSNKLPSLLTVHPNPKEITYGEVLEVPIRVKAGDQAAKGKIGIYHQDLLIKTVDLDQKGSYLYQPSRESLAAGSLRIKVVYAGDSSTAASEASVELSIAPKKLGLTVNAQDKTYDGSKDAKVELILSGVLWTDQITAAGDAAFETSAVGLDKLVLVSGIALRGEACRNYTLDTAAVTKASIHHKLLTANLRAHDKVYDGTDQASVSTELLGVVEGEVVNANTTGCFVDAVAGKDKTVDIIGVELIGATATNYDVKIDTLPTASILPRELKLSEQDMVLYYSGFPQKVRITADIEGVELIYSYYKDGVEIAPPIIFCGEYIVKAVPKSSNYSGAATLGLKILPGLTLSTNSPPKPGEPLTRPIAVLGEEVGFIDPESGHLINRAEYTQFEPMLQISEPDSLEYSELQDGIRLLEDYDGIGLMSLSLTLKLDAKDGGESYKSALPDQTILICLPYPPGLDLQGYRYQLLHIGKNGPEMVALRPTEQWLEFQIDRFSPFALAYSKKPAVIDPIDPVEPSPKPGGTHSLRGSSAREIDWQWVYRELTQTDQPVVIYCSGLAQIPAFVIDGLRDTDRILTLVYQGEEIQISGRYLPAYEPDRIYYSVELLCQKYGAGLLSAPASRLEKEPILAKAPQAAAKPYRPKVSYQQEPIPSVYHQAQEAIETAGQAVKNSALSFAVGIALGVLVSVAALSGVKVFVKKCSKKRDRIEIIS